MTKQTNLKIFILVCLVFFFVSKSSHSAELIDKIVAVVNDDLITLSELKERAALLNSNPDAPKQDEKSILDQMIEQRLLEQEAKKLGISVTENEVDAALEGVKKNFNLTDEQMIEVLKKQNLTPEVFREQWRIQLLANKLVASQLKGQIAVTEDEIKKEYEESYGKVEFQDETKIAHILIPVTSPEEEDKAKELALEVAERAKSGEDFGELAKEYSKDESSAQNRGELGYFKKGDLVEPLEEAVRGASVGEIVGPVRSPSGYHVIKILDKKRSGKSSLDDYRDEIKEKLYRQKAEKALEEWIENIKKTAYIEVKL
jgi:peptidyl-prolyl cis-trans isomerase SurA